MHLSGVAGISPQDRPARDRILLTAHDLFYRDGVRATGIDRVIAEAGVTKVTFYRHFPSKNDLIRTFLAYRHEQWMAWFIEALGRHGAGRARKIEALVPALREWLDGDNYRGCAFLNSVSELGGVLPEVMEIARTHKMDMTAQIEGLMPPSRQRSMNAQVIALAVDGAILQAQYDAKPDGALKALQSLLKMMTRSPS